MTQKSPGMVSHLFFATLSTGGSQIVGFLAFVVLARLLGTQAFGLVSVAAFLIDLMQVIGAAGMGDAIVQRRTLEEGEIDTAFWANLGLGALLFAVVFIAAPEIAKAYRLPLMTHLLRVLSVLFLIVPLGAIHTALMTRELRFKSLAARALAASAAGAAAGIPLAYADFGVWALVAQRLVTAAVSVLACWHAYRWIPRPRFEWQAFRRLIGFGGFVTGSNLVLQINTRLAELMCGFLAGPAAVSLIRAGSRFMEIVNQLTFAPLQQISMPVQSRAQDDRERRLNNYMTMSRLSACVMFPAYFGCLAIAHPLVGVVFGPQWQQAAYAIQILALSVVPLQLNVLTIGNVNAAGASRLVFGWTLMQVAVGVTAVYLVWPYGWKAMLLTNVARSYLLLPLGLFMLNRTIGIPFAKIAASIGPALCAAVLMMATVLAGQRVLATYASNLAQLLLLVPIGAIVYSAAIAILMPSIVPTLAGFARQRLRSA